MYPSVQTEEYPAEGGTLVACHGGLAQEEPAPAPARLQPFCEAWASFASLNGNDWLQNKPCFGSVMCARN